MRTIRYQQIADELRDIGWPPSVPVRCSSEADLSIEFAVARQVRHRARDPA
ncbi:MAG: hypothetical protein R2713_15850 [Ilumatobacteraceae bacterium]